VYIIRNEHYNQISEKGGKDSTVGCVQSTAIIHSPIQSKKIYSAAIICLSCTKNYFQNRLSRHHFLSGRLKSVPHFTTLHKASQRLLKQKNITSLLSLTIANLTKQIPLAAIDATGFLSGHISPYYYSIRERASKNLSWNHFKRWPKMAIIIDVDTHLIIACYPMRGPGRDTKHFKETLAQLPPDFSIKHIVADAGYDSEATHVYAREELGIITTIPPTASPKSKNLPHKPYRRLMAEAFDSKSYKQRWQVETAFSMMKRNLGYTIRAKNELSQNAEIVLLALTHNIQIILFVKELFYRATLSTLHLARMY
jgi:transposase